MREARLFGVTMVMRIDGDPMAAAPTIRKALSSIDPTQSFYAIETMEQALAESIAPRRFNLLLLGTFAIVALVVATLGVYSVVAYSVSERTHEIGIRLALGAERARVVRMIVGQGMASVVAGIVIGLAAAVMATRVIAGLLYGVAATDVSTFVLSTIMLTAVAFIACFGPALKAAVVDPVIALRAEALRGDARAGGHVPGEAHVPEGSTAIFVRSAAPFAKYHSDTPCHSKRRPLSATDCAPIGASAAC